MQIRDWKKPGQKALKNLIWERLGLHLGGFGGGFGKGLEALGAFWVVLEALFSCLYLEWSSKVFLETSWVDLGSIWEGFGNDLEALGAGLLGCFGIFFSCLYLEWSSKVLLEASGLDSRSIVKGLGRILRGFGEGLAAAQLKFKFKISSCFCLLFFVWQGVCTMNYGTHFELQL